MKYFFILSLLSVISINSVASEAMSKKQELFITQLITQQTKQQISVRKSIKSILSRYPEQIDKVYTKENIKYIDIYTNNLIFRVLDIMQDEECKVSDLAYEAHEARCKRVIKYFEGYLP